MEYKTFDPHQDLSAFVKCFWNLEGPATKGSQKQRILPDGCMEMIFHYGDLFKQYFEDGDSRIQPRCFVFGQITSFLEIEPTGITGIFAIRFHPEGFIPFANSSIKEMENKAVPLENIFGYEARQLEEQVLKAPNVSERIKYCEDFLQKRLVNKSYIDEVVSRTVDLILDINGQLTVDELSKKINVHRRQLERKFSHTVGLSPKQLAKIIRMKLLPQIFLLGSIVCLFSCSGTDSALNKSEWLIGTWEIQSPQGIYYEAWTKHSDSLMLGKSFSVNGKDTQYFESIEIKQEGENLFYIPTVNGQNNNQPVRFKLLEESGDELVFENKEHDFPQRIRYQSISADSLIAEISGDQGGKVKKIKFPMRKIK